MTETLPETVDKRTPLEKVMAVLDLFAEGGSIQDHMKAVGINSRTFYGHVYKNAELDSLYKDIKRGRADMNVDEAYRTGMDSTLDSRRARVRSEILLKIAAFYDRQQFGDKIDVTVDQRVSISGALSEARARALRPGRDLSQVQDAVIVPMQQLSDMRPPDNKSDAPAKPRNNPFED